ncbi:hypothetical protein ACJIZ3_002582 [Penstemon smallii]|uniref:Succinate dehydrogenase subunit 5, mitochondrial n=1 Tax=Penstemon smallii TaxID=265156 RepID=A0ABD3U6U2_9LAMI
MDKLMGMRSLCRSIYRRSQAFPFSTSAAGAAVNHQIRHLHYSSSSIPASSPNQNCLHAFTMRLGSTRYFSEDVSHMPDIKDPEIERAFKDLMAESWDKLPAPVVHDVLEALSKNTEDKDAQEVLKNVFRAAEAVEEFSGILISLKMDMDDAVGLSGENVKPLPEEYGKALKTIFDRYSAYLASFSPEESYLKKKVESELGTRMIYLKMRCSGLGAEWGKVTHFAKFLS